MSERDKLILSNLHLVRYIALDEVARSTYEISYEDIYQYGVIGLIDAANRFDSSKGSKFKTYASIRISGSIIDAIRNNMVLVRKDWDISKRIEFAKHLFETQGIKYSTKDLSKVTGLSKKQIEENEVYRKHGQFVDPFEVNSLNKFERQSLTQESIKQRNAFDYILHNELKSILNASMRCLSDRERLIINSYFTDELTLKEIAKLHGITESRVSQILKSCLKRLRVVFNKRGKEFL